MSPAIVTGVKVGVISITFMTWGIKVSVGRSMRSRTSFLRPVTVMGRSAGVRGSQVVWMSKEVIRRRTVDQIMWRRGVSSRRQGPAAWWRDHVWISVHLKVGVSFLIILLFHLEVEREKI